MKNSSARYRLKLVDRGPFRCESVSKAFLVSIKEKWHIEKKTSIQ